VAAQLDAVLEDLPVVAVKVGMIGDRAVAEVIAARIERLPHLVIDPVLVSTSGSRLSAVAFVQPLLAYPSVLTPNRHEAGALVGRPVTTSEEMVLAAAELAGCGAGSVVLTGSASAVDVLHHAGEVEVLHGSPVATRHNHGSGCTFSSAIAVRLAVGDPVPLAVRNAKRYVAGALRGGRKWEIGKGPGPLDHFGWS
jgi:hydroxymethylpyrimidine/phosphomethylpyrimidine kinase